MCGGVQYLEEASLGQGELSWNGGGMGGELQHLGRGSMGSGHPPSHGVGPGGRLQEGEVDGRPKPGGGRVYEGGLLSSTIDNQAPARREEQIKCPTLFLTHLTFLNTLQALSVGRRLGRPTRLGTMFLVGYCVSSIHCTSGNALLYNKRSSVPDEEVLSLVMGRTWSFVTALMWSSVVLTMEQ